MKAKNPRQEHEYVVYKITDINPQIGVNNMEDLFEYKVCPITYLDVYPLKVLSSYLSCLNECSRMNYVQKNVFPLAV